MKKIIMAAVAVAAGMWAAAVPGFATVLTFEGVVKDTQYTDLGYTAFGAYYFENGFNITAFGERPYAVRIFGKDYPNLNGDGSAVFGMCNDHHNGCSPSIAIGHWGALFDFTSLDFSTLWDEDVPRPEGFSLVLRGYRHGHVFEEVVPFEPGVWKTFAPEDPENFTDLLWLTIQANGQGHGDDGDFALDNINLRYVPEPAGIALVLAGLALLVRRRRAMRV